MEKTMINIAELQGEIVALLNLQIHIREKLNELTERKKELEKQL